MGDIDFCKGWQPLREGDVIDVIAPASACLKSEASLNEIRNLLISWKLVPRVPNDILEEDLLCANTDEKRFSFLKEALLNSESKAVWCLRGGYGSARLMDRAIDLKPNTSPKLFIGMSDITVLHLFLQQQFGWATLHGPSVRQVTDKDVEEDNIQELRNIIFGKERLLHYKDLIPLNSMSVDTQTIAAEITGGNLCLVQTSIGTFWQANARGKILFLEDVNERGYRIDRMLLHLQHAGILDGVAAILFGDFTKGNEPDGSSLVEPVLTRFAEHCNFPVLQYRGIGHGKFNRPLPLGTKAQLQLGSSPVLTVEAGYA